jgi:hypothetical protein
MDSAKSISLELGIPEDNIVFLRDDQATAQGMREAIQQLDRRVQSGDRVFVYYSGHGVRWIDPDVDKNSCTEGLMATDGQAITNREMSELMAPITKKAEKLIVFYDACHSGGIANRPLQTRSIQKNGLQLTPKFVSQVSPELCATPSNLKTRSLSAELKKRGAQPVNVVSIAASRPDEVSFDDPRTGGLATASWRDCLKGAAKDLDSSGALSVDEITACAQQRIDEKLNQFPEILGQKMTIGGNQRFVPSYFAQAFDATAQSALQAAVQTVSQAKPNASIKETATAVLSAAGQAAANTATQAVMTAANQAVAAPAAAQPAISKAQSEAEKEKTNPIVVDSQKSEAPVIPASPAMTLAVAPTPAFEPIADMTPTLPTPTTQVMGPEQLLEQIHAQRDVSRVLKFKSLSQKLKIDQDALQLTIQSPKQGYLYLAMAGSDGKSLYLLFPNQLEQNNLIQAGVTKSLPSKNWRIVAGGPKGVDTLLAVVTDSPRDLSLLQGESAGPFVMPLMTKNGKSQLQQLLATSSNGSEAVCQSGSKTRNLKIVQACSDAYASSILRVEELP